MIGKRGMSMIAGLIRLFRKPKPSGGPEEYDEIVVHIDRPIPPAHAGIIRNNTEWKAAVAQYGKLGPIDPP